MTGRRLRAESPRTPDPAHMTSGELVAEVERLREALAATKSAWAAADEQAAHERGRRTTDTYLAAAALVEDRACDADFTHNPQHIAGLREAAELLARRAGEVR